MINGSCLCGKVKYQISGKLGDIVHCHCQSCRKAHAAAFSSVASVSDSDFQLMSETPLSEFESSPGKHRYFCRNCGTQIYAKRVATEHIILRLGSLDDDPDATEKNHIWVSQKASWYSINGELPEYPEFE
ncbi:MAG: GFA family protein [Pseudomonadales bacterium]|nr:GFA family protein [Pseudomonadales bacterium]NRA17970.1 GFA family protein [Oceanospirillaceae bacterium]